MRALLPTLLIASLAAAQPTNHALTGVATQSTTGQALGGPEKAIDGDPDGSFFNGSVTHTMDQPNSWWEVTLTGPQIIHEIRLFNRADCCAQRLSNFRVTVFSSMTPAYMQDFYTTAGSVPIGDAEVIELTSWTVGDRVRVELLGTNLMGNGVLSLAEVEVIEYAALPDVNIAPLGVASQSSTANGGVAERAIDGNRDGFWGNGSVSHTADTGTPNEWFEVALPNLGPVDLVRLWNRSDCCANRLSNFRVSLWDGATQVWFVDAFPTGNVAPGGSWEATPPPGTLADRVRVELLGFNGAGTSVISLAECEVIRRAAGLTSDATRVSAMTGGTIEFLMDGGTSRAGMTHLLAGGVSGVAPGIVVAGLAVPLNPDLWTDFMVLAPNTLPYGNTLGALDLRGRGVATLSVPPGIPGIVGLTFHHVLGVVDGSGVLVAVSNAAPLTVDP